MYCSICAEHDDKVSKEHVPGIFKSSDSVTSSNNQRQDYPAHAIASAVGREVFLTKAKKSGPMP